MGSLVKVQNAVVKKEIKDRDKPLWITIGKLFIFDDGQSLILESVPVGNWWDGKIFFYDQKPRDEKPAPIPEEETDIEPF